MKMHTKNSKITQERAKHAVKRKFDINGRQYKWKLCQFYMLDLFSQWSEILCVTLLGQAVAAIAPLWICQCIQQ